MEASTHLITAPETAELVRDALRLGDNELANRRLVEAISRLIQAAGETFPERMFDKPRSTGDDAFDAVLAAAFLFATRARSLEPPRWAAEAPGLPEPRVWGSDGQESKKFVAYIRGQTPSIFLERNILTRDRDWRTA